MLLRPLLLLFSFLFLTSVDCKKEPCFTVIKATKQTYIAGIKNGGKGANYKITGIARASSNDCKIENLWVGNEMLEAKAFKYRGITPEENFSTGDTIFIEASRFTGNVPEENSGPAAKTSTTAPVKYKGEALITFRCGSKTRYKTIKKFEELPRINTP